MVAALAQETPTTLGIYHPFVRSFEVSRPYETRDSCASPLISNDTDELGRPAHPGAYSFRDVQNALPTPGSASQRLSGQGYAGYPGRVSTPTSVRREVELNLKIRLNNEGPQPFPQSSNTQPDTYFIRRMRVGTRLRGLPHFLSTPDAVAGITASQMTTLAIRMESYARQGHPAPLPTRRLLQTDHKAYFVRLLRQLGKIQKT